MSRKLFQKSKRLPKDAGIALLTTLMLLFLMSSLLVGFAVLLLSNQQLAGANNDQVVAFYAAEAGMEKMTADLGALFSQTYSPNITEINALETTPYGPPASTLFPGESVSYTTADGNIGYTIVPQDLDGNGNPAATPSNIKSGPYQGMTALATTYNLTVNARTSTGREVSLTRTTQTVGIPMFQFAIFCEVDCAFHAGSNYTVSGRVHGNGNLFLGSGATLTMEAKVDAYKDIIRAYMDNGANTQANWGGNVSITTTPSGGSYRNLAFTEGSYSGSSCISGWTTVSTGSSPTDYGSNLINGKGSPSCGQYSTGAQQLNLAVVTMGGGTTQPIDLIRRPAPGESFNVTAERYFAQSSLAIFLSDNPGDIMNLPCMETTTQPFDLSTLAQPVGNWPASTATLQGKMTTYGTTPLPVAASGAAKTATAYNAADGYWLPYGYPIVKGYIKIIAQTNYAAPCTSWIDVTAEILGLGYVGRNINPQSGLAAGTYGAPTSTVGEPLSGANLPGAQLAPPTTCSDPHPNAIIRLERVRDNPSNWLNTVAGECGNGTGGYAALLPSDFWNNTIFDPREGELRDTVPGTPYNNLPTLNGTMHYIELDTGNLAKWFAGTIGSSGHKTFDSTNSPNDFSVYISDRRGNYTNTQTWTGTWPALSPQGHETGEYGWDDVVNSVSDPTNGCPNNSLDTGENLDLLTPGQLFTYGALAVNTTYIMDTPASAAGQETTLYNIATGSIQGTNTTGGYYSNGAYGEYGFYPNLVTNGAILANPNCGTPSYASGAPGPGIWPMMYAALSNSARENPPVFFRRSVKIVNGRQNLATLFNCPTSPSVFPCGLSIATENPVYLQGDFNADYSSPGTSGFSDASVGSSIAADAITILSNNWNDINSFAFSLYANNGPRNPTTTYWRAAVIAGKSLSFPQFGTSSDNGTDGGMHNFLREVENWGGTSATVNYEGALVNLFYHRQATSIFKYGNTVYTVPVRYTTFDTNFLNPSLLPPRTPMFREINTTGWTRVMAPETTNYK